MILQYFCCNSFKPSAKPIWDSSEKFDSAIRFSLPSSSYQIVYCNIFAICISICKVNSVADNDQVEKLIITPKLRKKHGERIRFWKSPKIIIV